jgi:beta-glucosidase
VIFGTCSPSGKLPTTFPVQIEDTPAYANWPGENGNVEYKEGLFVGYRYYDREQIEPMFAFGHGLSYSRFKYSDLKIYKAMTPEPQQVLEVSFVLKNVGRSPASETAQLYIRDLQSSQPRPCKELQGFKKVFLRQGEETTVVMKIDKYSVGYYNTDLQTWIAEEGEFQAMIGASSADIRYFDRPRSPHVPFQLTQKV